MSDLTEIKELAAQMRREHGPAQLKPGSTGEEPNPRTVSGN
jgi:hypothetical protein